MASFKETIYHMRNYSLSQIAMKALAFLSIPVLTRLLTPADYGTVSIFLSYLAVFTIIFALSTEKAIGRYYYEQKDDFKEFFSTTMILSGSLCLFFSLIFLLFRAKIGHLLKLDGLLVCLMVPLIWINIISSSFGQVFAAKKESKIIAATQSIRSYLGFGIAVCCILLLNEKKYIGVVLGTLITGTLMSVWWIWKLREYFIFTFKKSALVYILKYSLPMIPYFLSGLILSQFGRVMVANYKGFSAAGLYSFASNIGGLMSMFVAVTNQAWIPYYFGYMNEKDYAGHDKDVNRLFRLTLFIGLGLSYFGSDLAILLSAKSFHSSIPLIPVVVLGYVFYQVFTIYGRNFGFALKTYYGTIIIIFCGIINILLNIYTIPRFGYIAAAYTTMFSYFCMAILTWFLNKYIIRLHHTSIKILSRPFLLFAVFYMGYYFLINIRIYYIALVCKTVLIILFGLLLFWSERKVILGFLKR